MVWLLPHITCFTYFFFRHYIAVHFTALPSSKRRPLLSPPLAYIVSTGRSSRLRLSRWWSRLFPSPSGTAWKNDYTLTRWKIDTPHSYKYVSREARQLLSNSATTDSASACRFCFGTVGVYRLSRSQSCAIHLSCSVPGLTICFPFGNGSDFG